MPLWVSASDDSMPPTMRRILEAAEELFSEKGFGEPSLSEIAARAGVSKPLIIWYFGSRRNLVRAVAERAMPTTVVEECLGRGLRGRELIGCVVEKFFETYGDERKRRLLAHSIGLAEADPEVGSYLRGIYMRLIVVLAERAYGRDTLCNRARARGLLGALLCHVVAPVVCMPIELYKELLLELYGPEREVECGEAAGLEGGGCPGGLGLRD